MTENQSWIMETPDNGKTITRRRFNEHGFKQVLIGDKWWSMDDMKEYMLEHQHDTQLAEKYPAVKAAWEEYQTVLELAKTQEQNGQGND